MSWSTKERIPYASPRGEPACEGHGGRIPAARGSVTSVTRRGLCKPAMGSVYCLNPLWLRLDHRLVATINERAFKHEGFAVKRGDGFVVQAKFPRRDEVVSREAWKPVGIARSRHEQMRIRRCLQDS